MSILNNKKVQLQVIALVEMYDREHQARKTSLLENVTDVFTHQNASSEPFVSTFDTKVRQLML